MPDVTLVHHRFASDTTSSSQPDPLLDPTLLSFLAIMVDNPLDPFPPHLLKRTVQQDRAVLHWNTVLIVEPISYPKLYRLTIQASRIHAHMIRIEAEILTTSTIP